MKIGVPSEIKTDEYRVAITPAGVRELTGRGHEVIVQRGAGVGSAISDEDFTAQGATIVDDAAAVFEQARDDPEGQGAPARRGRDAARGPDALHLPAPRRRREPDARPDGQRRALHRLRDRRGRAGPPAAARADERGRRQDRDAGRRVHARAAARRARDPARRRARASPRRRCSSSAAASSASTPRRSRSACRPTCSSSTARSTACATSKSRSAARASTVYSSTLAIEEMLPHADLVIGAVLVAGGRAPHVIKREQLKLMKRNAVLVDVSIDQGGCFETSRPTTHTDPTFEVDGVTHYCVANMPGAVPITSTYALTNATIPYVIELADAASTRRSRRTRACASGSTSTAARSSTRRSPRRSA